MLRLATILITFAALVATSLALPGAAGAAGCEVLREPAERAECVARQEARTAARTEVERRLRDAAPAQGTANGRTAAWQRAIDDSGGIDPGALLDVRLVAAVGGLAWFVLALRARRRSRRRTA